MQAADYFIYALGFVGQGMFGARTIAQWIHSERAGRVVSPTIFWVFSVCGSLLFLVYGVIRRDPVIIVGQTISFYIYVRNLQLKNAWQGLHWVLKLVLLPAPFLILLGSVLFLELDSSKLFEFRFSDPFLVAGMIGQLLLNFRYVYQWYFSERAHESLLPLGFWIISAFASILVVVYGYYRQDPVLLAAQAAGLVAYLRNIWIYSRNARLNR